jgi:hypothetical protein
MEAGRSAPNDFAGKILKNAGESTDPAHKKK